MRSDEFCQNMIGIPWSERACSDERVDCWGLVVLYFRQVLGIELHQEAGYQAGNDFITCYRDNVVFWEKSEIPQDNCIFVCYTGSNPNHVGIILNGMALHASQSAGCVRYDKLRVIERNFTKVEFLRYAVN